MWRWWQSLQPDERAAAAAMNLNSLNQELWRQVLASPDRLQALIATVADAPAPVFWPVFLNAWPFCIATWRYQNIVLEMLRVHTEQQPARAYMAGNEARSFDALPDRVTVYRGCPRSRAHGLSWSTDLGVAKGFLIDPFDDDQDRVLVRATIPKAHIFASRMGLFCESEILLDPGRLENVQIEPGGTD